MIKIRTVIPSFAVGVALVLASAPAALAEESVPGVAASVPEEISSQRADYVPQSGGAEGASLLAYPTGCGLVVLSYKGNLDAVGSVASSCPYNVTQIKHKVTIDRSRWYGWERLAENGTSAYETTSHGTIVSWYCGDKGTYTYKVVGQGEINNAGQWSTAAAYDEARYDC
ncbi:hypothetical protein ACFP3U_18620 [Kitasatospora misakiensis]|uniref:Secreted protein n=1 Tax=Kitasatospora misakiensis TaxID=67330 RepID=A0ABW0X3G3_9ACTN